MTGRPLDFIALGRSSVDLYGEQLGGRLEDMASFAKYVGGSPANTAVGGARLGLKTALITRVGNEHMGRFIRETLADEGVDVRCVKTDPARMTALVILGIRDQQTFPLIFYRENCADMAITPDDFDESFITSARALVVSGTHFSAEPANAASRAAMTYARRNGTKVVLDIDYRPVLWGLTGKGEGEKRFIKNETVSAHLQSIIPDCDLIVGTEEEFHIAGGSTDTLAAIRKVRQLSRAIIVCKRGPMGCVVFPGDIPATMEGGITGAGFSINVYNVLGAGDAFMSGFLRGWLRHEPLAECCRIANATGAFVVSRHGCAPAVPSWEELSFFLKHGSTHKDLRFDPALNQLHWSTTRHKEWPEVLAFAFDHRSQFEDLAARYRAGVEKIGEFKELALTAATQTLTKDQGLGVLIDERLGSAALFRATNTGGWIGRPIEVPGAVPLRFEGGQNVAATLREWPVNHVVKCLVFYHPEDAENLRREQEQQVMLLQQACRTTQHELLLEVIAGKSRPATANDVAAVMQRFYTLGVYPDWWKLECPGSQRGWDAVSEVIAHHDAQCRGVLLLGLNAREEKLKESLKLATAQEVCKGFAIGRTIFGAAAEGWFSGTLTSDAAVKIMADSYSRLAVFWKKHRQERHLPCRQIA
ncbi:MAG: 5-dehydro-2-deoxygluconokinase [Proteobacteria bacterium]|nr:5-dehydro-2-deoxygluconokinase [Pseudomonadota bacterium]